MGRKREIMIVCWSASATPHSIDSRTTFVLAPAMNFYTISLHEPLDSVLVPYMNHKRWSDHSKPLPPGPRFTDAPRRTRSTSPCD